MGGGGGQGWCSLFLQTQKVWFIFSCSCSIHPSLSVHTSVSNEKEIKNQFSIFLKSRYLALQLCKKSNQSVSSWPYLEAVLRILDILVWIRIWIRGSMPLTDGSGFGPDADPDPAIFQCCGSGMFIPDPTFSHPGSRIRTVSIPDPRSRIRN
jgi:hypothetical protein